MNVFQGLVFTLRTFVQVASIRIYPLVFLTIYINGPRNLVIALTRRKNSLQTTESGKAGHKALALSLLPMP